MASRRAHRQTRSLLISAVCLAGAIGISREALSQVTFPGQYPPGQYPPGQGPYPGGGAGGGRMPGGRRGSTTTTTKEEQARTSIITGMVRRVSKTDIVVEAEDKRIVSISLATGTTYSTPATATAKLTDFGPGDHVTIDATQDDNGYYHARNVTLVRHGNAEEQVAASESADVSPLADGARSGGDDDRPRMRRAPSNSDDSKQTAGAKQNRTVTPQIAAGDSGDSPATARNVPDTPVPPDPDDAGPPKLRRGGPQRNASSDSDAAPKIARNDPPVSRPTLHADEVNGVTKAPVVPQATAPQPARQSENPGPQNSGDVVIDKARQAATGFAETLPNYVVKQFTTRFQTEAAHGAQTSWRAIDNVSADVVSEAGRETYKNILINGKPPKEAIEKTGSWSTGEFQSVLLDVLSPQTDADFHNRRSTMIVNRAAWRYDFSVDQENSHWHVYSAADSYRPEYSGAIWIDKENSRVLRIEMSARKMPKAFPLDTVESAVDYDYVLIGESKFLLPVHSEALSCERGTGICSRNVIDFRNYKKFGADTSITFDPTSDK